MSRTSPDADLIAIDDIFNGAVLCTFEFAIDYVGCKFCGHGMSNCCRNHALLQGLHLISADSFIAECLMYFVSIVSSAR